MRMRLLLRQAASSLGASLAIVLLTLVAAGLLTAWPQLTRASFIDEVNYRLSQAGPTARYLTGSTTGIVPLSPIGGATFDTLVDQLQQVVDDADPALAPLLGDPMLRIATSELEFAAPGGRPSQWASTMLSLTATNDLADHITITGTAPTRWSPTYDSTTQPLQFMVSAAVAQQLGLTLGDLVLLPLSVPIGNGQTQLLQGQLVATFEPTDPADPYWLFQPSALTPRITTDPNVGDFALGAAYIDTQTPAQLLNFGDLTFTTAVSIPVQAQADSADAVLNGLLDITARQIQLGDGSFASVTVRLASTVTDILTGAIAARVGITAVLSLLAAGPIGVTFALIALSTTLTLSRRTQALALVQARGGAPAQVRAALAGEGLALGLPASAVGVAVASVLVGPLQATDLVLPATIALAPAAFGASATLPSLRPQRADLRTDRGNGYQRAVQLLTVAAAAGSVYLLLSRGLQQTSAVDPVATAAPLLVSLGAAVLAMAAFVWPMRLVHAATRRSRGLGNFLGSARAVREPVAGFVPMLALVVATSIAVFSTTMVTTFANAAGVSGQRDIGADVRLVGPPYDDAGLAAIAAIDGVQALSPVFTQPNTRLTTGSTTTQTVLLLVDTTTIGTVQTGITDAVDIPVMTDLVDGKVPVVIAAGLDPGGADASVKMRDPVAITVVGTGAAATGLSTASTWIIADLNLMRDVTGQALMPRMVLVDVADGDPGVAAIDTITTAYQDSGSVDAVATNDADYVSSPSAKAMRIGFIAAIALSLLQSIVAVVLTLILAAPARGRLIAVLRTLGMPSKLSRRLVAWEIVPLMITAIVVGAALGLALPHLVTATTDLSAFTGQTTAQVAYSWPLLALVLAITTIAATATVGIASIIARRLSLSVLRIGEAS